MVYLYPDAHDSGQGSAAGVEVVLVAASEVAGLGEKASGKSVPAAVPDTHVAENSGVVAARMQHPATQRSASVTSPHSAPIHSGKPVSPEPEQQRPAQASFEIAATSRETDDAGQSAAPGVHPPAAGQQAQPSPAAVEKAGAEMAQVVGEAERLHTVRSRLERFKHYPSSARRRGIEGAVDVSFRLNGNGRAEDMQLMSGSGYSILDDAALSTVRRAEPFPVHQGSYRFRLRFTRS
ncbi:MAG: TonB family protein [Mariprofundaceae bacterium]|nr:TonB family protein [Mariprofundaceae bacterium]